MVINVGIIGFGRMGRFYLEELHGNSRFVVRRICDVSESCRAVAGRMAPEAIVTADVRDVFEDPSISLVVLCATAASRLEHISMAVRHGKHIIAEKPIADTVEHEEEAVALTRGYDRVCTVNMYLRNSWYHNTMREFVESGQIGELAILRVCHMTPGLAPGEGHESEGPCFHDCGMHYVDLARWYAGSEYKTMHSQGLRMWGWKDPWWVQCHGTFCNGVVYDITQGFVYGQLSKDQTHNSYVDIIGSRGLCRMTHDFKNAHVELRGTDQTFILDRPFGGKNIDRLIEKTGVSIETGRRDPSLPGFADSAVASRVAWEMFEDSLRHELPVKGTGEELVEIRARRARMTNGYGLLPSNHIGQPDR